MIVVCFLCYCTSCLWTCFVFKKKKRCLGGCFVSCSDSCFGLQCFSVESAKPYTTRLVLRKENAPSVSGRENSKLQRQSPLLFWNSIRLGDWAKLRQNHSFESENKMTDSLALVAERVGVHTSI